MGDLDLFVIDVFMDFDFELEAESFLLTSFKVAVKLPAISFDRKEPPSKIHLKVLFFDAGEGNVEVEALFVGASFENGVLDLIFKKLTKQEPRVRKIKIC